MNRSEARQRIAAFPKDDISAAFASGIALLNADYSELLLPSARVLASRFPTDARAQQLLGLAARSSQESALAVQAFYRAAVLAPVDPLIAHSRARTALEAGEPAVELFERAIRLAPQDGTARLGLAAALVHEGRAQDSVDLLDQLLVANPGWIEGHRDAAHIRSQLGLDPYTTVEAALAKLESSEQLHELHSALRLEALDFSGAASAIDAAVRHVGSKHHLRILEAHTASEIGEIEKADAIFDSINASKAVSDASLFARHLLRTGRVDKVDALLQPLITKDYDHLLWPYLSLAWRITADPRWDWLEGDSGIVGIYDIAHELGDVAAIAEHLRGLHFAEEQPLDQSVRGGTQTDGNLLLRTDDIVRHLRKTILKTVRKHVDQLPGPTEGHPTKLAHSDPLRVAGSWSVRLRDAGFHADHVHSKGWISSALYLALPETLDRGDVMNSPARAGWLSLGECRDLLPDLEPVRMVEPVVGRLVLFPSTMWHGTRPFPKGERVTVAFDIARPKQSGNR